MGPGCTCTTTELAKYFLDYGLRLGSRTHIRIHACDSGSNQGNQSSFAQGFKDAMVSIGYTNVTIRGYKSGMGYYFMIREGENPFTRASDTTNLLQFDPPLS